MCSCYDNDILPNDLEVIEAVFLDRYSVKNTPLFNFDNVKSTWRRCEMKPSINQQDGDSLSIIIDGLSFNLNNHLIDNSALDNNSQLEDLIEVEHYNDVNDNFNKNINLNED